MRIWRWLLASSILVFAAGCNHAPTSVADGGTSAASTPVGPVPGEVQTIHFRANPLAHDPVALQDGRRLFDWYNCSGCHFHGAGGIGPALINPQWRYGGRIDQIHETLVQGRPNGMPSWGGKIPDDQLWQISAYVRSLSTPPDAISPK